MIKIQLRGVGLFFDHSLKGGTYFLQSQMGEI